MSPEAAAVFARTDWLVQPVVLHVWPAAEYDVPFFLGMQSWSDGALRATVVWLVCTNAEEEVATNAAVAINGRSLAVSWKDSIPCDITENCVPGRNTLSFRNYSAENALSLSVFIEARRRVPLSSFLPRIPGDAEDIDLCALSFGSRYADDVCAMGSSPSPLCPISRIPIGDAVRGRECKHAQCFDSRSFLALAAVSNIWECPVCGCTIYPENLVRSSRRL
jgi:MIZ/SP-RING zinc finger